MTKRRFDTTRAYKLLMGLVIVIALFLGGHSLYIFRIVNSGSLLNGYIKFCDGYGTSKEAENIVNDCRIRAYGIENQVLDRGGYELIIAFVLPILFFGGTGLYKYLFPKIKEDR